MMDTLTRLAEYSRERFDSRHRLDRSWRRLWLPRKVRSLWESQFPSLSKAA
jgi:hypothetical protein